jgi:Flp pilus assembly protein TadG
MAGVGPGNLSRGTNCMRSTQCTGARRTEKASHRATAPRRGNIVVFSAFLMIVFMAMLALSVDVGYMYTMQTQLQRAVDAAALAGAGELVNGTQQAQNTATEYLVRNPVGQNMTVFDETALASQVTTFMTDHGNEGLEFKIGNWNATTRTMEETTVMPASLEVSMTYQNLPFFFGRVLGHDNFTITASSTAQFQPRDIVVVLDYSASMNDDSTYAALGKIPQATIDASLLNCWNDLGPPTYGSLPAVPNWVTVPGVPENTALQIPHIDVQYRYSSVYVASTQSLTQVKIEFSNGAQQTWSPGGVSGTFTGSGSNVGKQVRKVWVRSGSNDVPFGSSGEYFNFTSGSINTTIKNALGLNTVAYPYGSNGSWDAYIDYVESSNPESSGNDNADAGYRYKFGGMNLVEWWLRKYPENAKTPDHWKCRAEPLYALKDATGAFMDFIGEVDTGDRVALVIYNGPDTYGKLEQAFTDDLDSISDIVSHRQAGHYHQYTNIGGGLKKGREHMDAAARPQASKLIVLMTDGLANWYNGSYNLSGAAQQIATETALCAQDSRKYKIMTISLGVEADTSTMQAVADGTGGKHYNVPGGADHQTMHDQLYSAFEEIAKARPLKLVK